MSMREEVLYGIFLDLHKAYNALDHNRYLYILAAYKLVPWTFRLLQSYWDILTMVSLAMGYFGNPFKGYHWMMQGNHYLPQSSTW